MAKPVIRRRHLPPHQRKIDSKIKIDRFWFTCRFKFVREMSRWASWIFVAVHITIVTIWITLKYIFKFLSCCRFSELERLTHAPSTYYLQVILLNSNRDVISSSPVWLIKMVIYLFFRLNHIVVSQLTHAPSTYLQVILNLNRDRSPTLTSINNDT